MKVGILTFHCAENYGAVLQCYATQEFLKSKGHEVHIIDYRPDYLLSPYRVFYLRRLLCRNPLNGVINLIKEFIHLPKRCYRRRAFHKFTQQHLLLTDTVTRDTIPTTFESYLVGSDQIWNTKITEGLDDVYFCNFSFPKEKRRYVAYAASMGKAELEDDKAKDYVCHALNHFDAISVREHDLSELLQPLTSRPILQVLDPTLMVNPQIWEKFVQSPLITRKYVAVYEVRMDKNVRRIAADIAKQIGGEIIFMDSWFSPNSNEHHKAVSPENFVNIIKHAACVVTTSFHGTAFSVIFNRPFYTIRLNDGADARSQSLLETLHLEERMVDKHSTPTYSSIDYTNANTILKTLRDQSQEFLQKALE